MRFAVAATLLSDHVKAGDGVAAKMLTLSRMEVAHARHAVPRAEAEFQVERELEACLRFAIRMFADFALVDFLRHVGPLRVTWPCHFARLVYHSGRERIDKKAAVVTHEGSAG